MKVVKISAVWCGPCKIYAPIFDKLKNEMEDENLQFISLDAEIDNAILMSKYKINSIPFTALEDDEGNIIRTHKGMMREEELRKFIQVK